MNFPVMLASELVARVQLQQPGGTFAVRGHVGRAAGVGDAAHRVLEDPDNRQVSHGVSVVKHPAQHEPAALPSPVRSAARAGFRRQAWSKSRPISTSLSSARRRERQQIKERQAHQQRQPGRAALGEVRVVRR